MKDRPKEADDRSEPGHLEMDTVVSCIGGIGGLLVLIDRCTREYFIERLDSISQEAVTKALKRMKRRGKLKGVKSVTADNGCEFLDPKAMKAVFGCNVYYTRAYASWEKGSVENCNRIVRRWYPKGTDFSLCTRADIRKLESTINSIHRLALGGMSAHDFAEAKRSTA
jgi:IS30 family transposase